jgi:hypothetical protein
MATTTRAIVRISFNKRQPPELREIQEAVEKMLGNTGCLRCGFDGIDVLLRLEEIFDPEPAPWVVTKGGGQVLAG